MCVCVCARTCVRAHVTIRTWVSVYVCVYVCDEMHIFVILSKCSRLLRDGAH